MNVIKRLLNVLPGELGLVVTLGFLLFGNSFALEVSDIVSTSGFLSQVSVPNILIVWIIDMSLIIVSAGLQSLVVDRFHRIQLMRWMSIILCAAYIALRVLFALGAPGWLSYSLLFLIADQSWLFFPLIFWVLANDIFDVAQGKRLFPLLIAIGFLGQIAGILVATLAPSVLSSLSLTSVELLEINAIIYLLIYVIVLLGFRKVNIHFAPRKSESLRETITEGWEFVKNVDSFRYMCMAYLGLAVVITVIRFNFLSFTSENVATADFQQFYGIYRLILIISSIVMTSFIASRLTKGIGLKNSFLITPVSLLLITLTALALPILVMITGGMIFAWLMYYTIDQSTRKTFQGLVPEERRGRVSMFIDSYVPASGVILASVLVGAVIIFGQLYGWTSSALIYLIIGALGAMFCIWATIRLRSTYDASLLNPRMKRRQRRSDVLDKLNF
jgi:AAA family ATP:ADP antiporter